MTVSHPSSWDPDDLIAAQADTIRAGGTVGVERPSREELYLDELEWRAWKRERRAAARPSERRAA